MLTMNTIPSTSKISIPNVWMDKAVTPKSHWMRTSGKELVQVTRVSFRGASPRKGRLMSTTNACTMNLCCVLDR